MQHDTFKVFSKEQHAIDYAEKLDGAIKYLLCWRSLKDSCTRQCAAFCSATITDHEVKVPGALPRVSYRVDPPECRLMNPINRN